MRGSIVAPKLLKSNELPMQFDSATLQRQFEVLAPMTLRALEYSTQGPVSLMYGDTGLVLPSRVEELRKGDSGAQILEAFKDVLLATGTETLVVAENTLIDDTRRTLRLQQSIRGIPVIYGAVSLEYDDASRKVSGLASSFVPDRNLPTKPTLSLPQAQEAVVQFLSIAANGRTKNTEFIQGAFLGYFASSQDPSPPRLAWVMQTASSEGTSDEFIVDADVGIVLSRAPLTENVTRTVYDVNNSAVAIPSGLTNAEKLTPAQVQANVSAKNPYDNVAKANTLLTARFPANAIKFPSTVKIIINYPVFGGPPNASSSTSGGVTYLAFTDSTEDAYWAGKPLNVVTHEYMHGYSVAEIGDNFDKSRYEVGAIREGMSDILAATADIANGSSGSAGSATWVIGHGIFSGSASDGFRSMKAPTYDSRAEFTVTQIDWYGDFRMLEANHENSTILTHAYYLLVHGGVHSRAGLPGILGHSAVPVIPVVGQGETKARNIFMNAYQTFLMDIEPNLPKMKMATMAAAASLYTGTSATTSVESAFNAVGVCGLSTVPPPQMALASLGDIMCAGRFYPTWNSVAGATRYYGEVASQALGFALPTPVTDVPETTHHCNFQVSGPSLFRIRACNDCGCGPWSQTYSLNYWSPCP